ncbi:MAG: hypothetical protein MJE66_19680 [Proteobacteria bacterium]|nr:hypothetical protein [Pseudomonadota bacterium]
MASLLSRLLWAQDPAAQIAILLVVGVGLLALALVYVPLAFHWGRVFSLRRELDAIFASGHGRGEAYRDQVSEAFQASAAQSHWREFLRRWRDARAAGQDDRAPVRLADIFEDRPLLGPGLRRSLLPSLPGLFLALGVLAAMLGLAQGALDPLSPLWREELVEPGLRAAFVGEQLAFVLRPTLWALMLSLVSLVAWRGLEGGFEAHEQSLDALALRAYGAISPGELASRSARAQREAFDQLHNELTRFRGDLTQLLDKRLKDIERSTTQAATLVSEEQRGSLRAVTDELTASVRRGVKQQLGTLQEAIERTTGHQDEVAGGLAEAFSRMTQGSETNARTSRALELAASAVGGAAGTFTEATGELRSLLGEFRSASEALERTTAGLERTQDSAAMSLDAVRVSLEESSEAGRQQRVFAESSLAEIRAALEQLHTGLGDKLQQALRGVDTALDASLQRLDATLSASNETFERMTEPVRAAEATSQTMQTALLEVRGEIESLARELSSAVRPVPETLGQLEERTGQIANALADFGRQAESVQKTMDSLRSGLGEEGRLVRNAGEQLGRRLETAAAAVTALERATGQLPRVDAPESDAPESEAPVDEEPEARHKERRDRGYKPRRDRELDDDGSGVASLLGRSHNVTTAMASEQPDAERPKPRRGGKKD